MFVQGNKATTNVIVNMNSSQSSTYLERDSLININKASLQALESLPGIGKVLAGRIIKERPFKDVHALSGVKGIGPKTIYGLIGKVDTQ